MIRRRDPPDDVRAWLTKTYYPQGVTLWLDAYRSARRRTRVRMVRIARMDMGFMATGGIEHMESGPSLPPPGLL